MVEQDGVTPVTPDLRAVLALLRDHVVVVGGDLRIRWASPSLAPLDGEALVGTHLGALVHEADRDRALAWVRRSLEQGPDLRPGPAREQGDGRDEPEVVRIGPVPAAAPGQEWCLVELTVHDRRHDPDIGGILVRAREVGDRVEAEARAREEALRDPLTGLPGRALLEDRLEAAVARARRSDRPFACLFIDIDGLKEVNDTRGHDAGDELLRMASRRLVGEVREVDTVARYGGDEFVVLLEDLGPRADLDVEEMCQALVWALAAPHPAFGVEGVGSASVGVVVSHGDDEPEEVLRHADVAMFRAKSEGRSTWVRYTADLDAGARSRAEIHAQLRAAVEGDALRLHHQPIVDLTDGRVVGHEALARVAREDGSLVPPAAFLPVARATDMLVELGARVLDVAAATAPGEGFVAVNLSPAELADPGLVERITTALAEHGLPPEQLVLDVTEATALVGERDSTRDNLRALRRVGVRFALDDFGRGRSNVERIRDLPVSFLKLDRSFVEGVARIGSGDTSAVRAVVGMAASLGVPVVAVGIENELQRRILSELGVQLGQGELFGPSGILPLATSR